MLTRKQKELLDYLTAHAEKSEVSPSFDEMRHALGLASKSGIHRLVSGLEERGYIRRLANRARAIEILKPVASAAADLGRSVAAAADAVSLPLLGKIAAGTPVEAIQNEVSRIPLPANIEKNGEFFGLKVQGDSMIEAGINNGDTVIVKKADTAENGKIVVALIDDHEAMLKRIRRKGKTIALESANRNYETKIFGPDRVKVQGVLVSLYRNF